MINVISTVVLSWGWFDYYFCAPWFRASTVQRWLQSTVYFDLSARNEQATGTREQLYCEYLNCVLWIQDVLILQESHQQSYWCGHDALQSTSLSEFWPIHQKWGKRLDQRAIILWYFGFFAVEAIQGDFTKKSTVIMKESTSGMRWASDCVLSQDGQQKTSNFSWWTIILR